jgi:hypothetical protein
VVKHDETEPRDNPVLNAEPFYGRGNFTQFGVSARFRFDGTDHLALPRKGVLVTTTGRRSPGPDGSPAAVRLPRGCGRGVT